MEMKKRIHLKTFNGVVECVPGVSLIEFYLSPRPVPPLEEIAKEIPKGKKEYALKISKPAAGGGGGPSDETSSDSPE